MAVLLSDSFGMMSPSLPLDSRAQIDSSLSDLDTEIKKITNPVEGLIVYDISTKKYYTIEKITVTQLGFIKLVTIDEYKEFAGGDPEVIEEADIDDVIDQVWS